MDKHQQQDKDKKELEQPSENTVDTNAEEGVVYLVNDDGTPFDTSDRTYVAVDLPDEETDGSVSSSDEAPAGS